MVAAMDKVGVDGAIYISPFSMYQYDGSYAVSVQRAHPDKFALVKPVYPDDPAVADVIADRKKTPGTVFIRIILTRLVHSERACAVRRGSAQPTIHKFTAPARHGVRRPVPSLSLIGRGKPEQHSRTSATLFASVRATKVGSVAIIPSLSAMSGRNADRGSDSRCRTSI